MTTICYSRRQDLALVHVTGKDARQFLHAQTTQSFVDMAGSETRLAAWLTPGGRVQAVFDAVADGDSFWLLTRADNADWLAKRLTMYVLRADTRLEVVTDPAVFSLTGNVDDWLRNQGIDLPPRGVSQSKGIHWVRIGREIVDVIGPGRDLERLFSDLPEDDAERATLAEIAAGRPDMPAALRDRFVAQMLNLDRLDAISFTKGCYPGQEIVARTENRGQVKRRLGRFRIEQGERPTAGDEMVDVEARVAGEVIRSARIENGYELLAVIALDSADKTLTLRPDGRALERLPLEGDG